MVLSRLKDALYDYLWSHIRRYYLSQGIYHPPFMPEICHCAKCSQCAKEIKRQGWLVEFKHKGKKIYEITFRSARYHEKLKGKEGRDRLYV